MATTDLSPSIRGLSPSQTPEGDPFNITPKPTKSPHRYSSFDNKLFSAYASASPAQAKRALEAHLLDTDRRIRDASRLGTSLLEQKKQLADRLEDVEQQQSAGKINPELKQKLEELEREYNELGRESARSFIPKTRQNGGSLTVGDGEVIENMPSPSKAALVQNASRKNRNTSSRVEDLAFATEISTSLLGQVRHLQNVLAEKEDALRKANSDSARREADARHTHLRLKSLDDNEQRYKDENWHLETQVQDLAAQLKESLARETKLGNALNAVHVDKSTSERELDEIRLSHNKLSEDHATLRKKHDTETSTLRRNIISAESDREVLQRKIAEVTSQNEELARAIAYRIRTEDAAQSRSLIEEDDELRNDTFILDPSPPASPTKGTPRHGALESETLKSSLHHAHRMIQNLKNNIHREKTEKLELRRMLQDARDEVESRRAEGGIATNAGKKRKPVSQNDLFKKPARPAQLGNLTGPTEEIINDPIWEEYEDSPSRGPAHRRLDSVGFSSGASDAFETANEADSTDAFDTAESVIGDDSEGDQTETEESAQQQKSVRLSQMRAGNRSSYLSTASSDGEDLFDLSTPVRTPQPRYKLKMSRGGIRHSSATPDAKDSPASFISGTSSQATTKQDLAAELEDLDESSIAESTPSRSIHSLHSSASSPDEFRQRDTVIRSPLPLLRPTMVDTGTVTDPWEPGSKSNISTLSTATAGAIGGVAATVVGAFGLGNTLELEGGTRINSKDISSESVASPSDLVSEEANTARHFSMSSIVSQSTKPLLPEATPLPAIETPATGWSFSGLVRQAIQPMRPTVEDKSEPAAATAQAHSFFSPPDTTEEPLIPIELSFSPIVSQSTAPVAPAQALLQVNAFPPSTELADRSLAGMSPVPMETSSMATTPKARSAPGLSTMPPNVTVPTTAIAAPKNVSDSKSDDVFLDDSAQSTIDSSPSAKENSEAERAAVVAARQEEKRMPFQQVSGNGSPRKQSLASLAQRSTRAEGTQTMLSAAQIEPLIREKNNRPTSPTYVVPVSPTRATTPGSGRTRTTAEPLPPPNFALPKSPVRPGSAGSLRKGAVSPPPPTVSLPPLPVDHREVIAAASRTSSLVGNMPPPNMTAVASKSAQQSRPRTPSGTFVRPQSPARLGSMTSQTSRPPSANLKNDAIPARSIRSITRRSSISSFASEIEERFNAGRPPYFASESFEMSTDPRMIQAITQTMIGEFMWKYTRKPGRGEHSENRHKRFFWIHPYTRTLYWSAQDPSHSNRSELKAKSVPIQAVRVVSDDNPHPPGLYPKSIVIVTPGRSIKFTAPTGLRHETWFNALSYLLLRSNPERGADATNQAAQYQSMRSGRTSSSVRGGSVISSTAHLPAQANYSDPTDRSTALSSLTSEDISEFNPTLHPRSSVQMSHSGRDSARVRSTAALSSQAQSSSSGHASLNQAGRMSASHLSASSSAQPRSLAARQSVAAQARSSATTSSASAAVSNASTAFHTPSSSTNTAAPSSSSTDRLDADGFRVPRARSAPSQQPRMNSLSSRSRAAMGSLFSRSRSRARASLGVGDGVGRLSSDSVGSVATGTTGSTAVHTTEGPGVGAGKERATVENVRACCDGKHDVSDLSHRSRHASGSLSGRHGL